jgi:hypothetical protein
MNGGLLRPRKKAHSNFPPIGKKKEKRGQSRFPLEAQLHPDTYLQESAVSMDLVREILGTNDGSLPDIIFEYGSDCVAIAYDVVRRRATCLASSPNSYWSPRQNVDVEFGFDDEPAAAYLAGEAEPFHVVFGGLRSSTGHAIPDLGVFVLDRGYFELDYQMGPEWNEAAILGLFEIMKELSAIAPSVEITHAGNDFDPDGSILLDEYRGWLNSDDKGPE